MKNIQLFSAILLLTAAATGVQAQYKSYEISIKGDTINAVRNDGKKVGKWINRVEELRGEPGFEEEGEYKNGEKNGYWRKYSLEGDLLAVENYRLGGKDGPQIYYNMRGDVIREEAWKAYNPDSPYDTVQVWGEGNNEIIGTKLVKAATYAVKHGDWKYYNEEDGKYIRTVKYELNREIVPKAEPVAAVEPGKKKEVKKTPEMLEWERKNKGKKKVLRDGQTGL